MLLILVGILFLLGLLLLNFPPKKNWFYGYRSSLAMKNDDTWQEGQKIGAKSMIGLGGILLLVSLFPITYDVEGIVVVSGCIAMVVFDEISLRRIFNNDGSRK